MADEGPPPKGVVLGMYVALGTALSLIFGREPGTLAADPVKDFAISAVAICGFFLWYSVFDVMSVGVLRIRSKSLYGKADDEPEDLRMALRVQANQVEQMTNFVTATVAFSVLVNGIVGGVLGCLWVLLRAAYAHVYRKSAGVAWKDKGLGTFTVPCYFLINSMNAATIVHMLRLAAL
mmetsp:Transcript_6634/g.17343  ORF Transcript_6634/g.17343 Transcript_6634/m.17343 type:complete len:178 (-) Transcript_6634:359-892(-)